MIRAALTAIGLWLAGCAAALACVCIEPRSEAERREIARRIASAATAVAEIELAEPLNYEAMRAELYRVVKVHVGKAPAQFRLGRYFTRTASGEVGMTMTSCDVVPPSGERTLVVLYGQPNGAMGIGGTCDHVFINSPGAIGLVQEEARKLSEGGERG